MLGAKLGIRLLLVIAGCALLANCSETKFASMAVKEFEAPKDQQNQGKGVYKVGDPYQIAGVWYYRRRTTPTMSRVSPPGTGRISTASPLRTARLMIRTT